MDFEDIKSTIVFDSRPMFNGEYSCFLKIRQIQSDLNDFMNIGAARDFFYLDLMCNQRCLFVEQGHESAQQLRTYINKLSMPNKIIAQTGLHPELESVNIYTGASIFKRKPLQIVLQAVNSGHIICPTTSSLIQNKQYIESEILSTARCVNPVSLLNSYEFSPQYIKIDIEGAEFIVIKEILKSFSPDFIQYEYGVTWFYADATHRDMMMTLDKYYHYIITPEKMFYVEQPFEQYFYANILASKYYLGDIFVF